MSRLGAWLRSAAHVETLWIFVVPFVWLGLGCGAIHLVAR